MKRGLLAVSVLVALVAIGTALADPVANYVRRAGDTMNGPLKFTTTVAGDPVPIQLLDGQRICWCKDAKCSLGLAVCLGSDGGTVGQDDAGTFVRTTGDTMTGQLNSIAYGLTGQPNTGIQFIAGSGTVQLVSLGTTIAQVSGTGSLDATASGGVKSAGTPVAFKATSTGGLQLAGVGAGSLPTCNSGTKYTLHATIDDNAFAVCDGTTWKRVITAAADGGTPWGPVTFVSGYNSLTAAATNTVAGWTVPAATTSVEQVMQMDFTAVTPGTGAGNFTFDLRDITGASTVCVSGNTACTLAAGAHNVVTCAPTALTAAHFVTTRINCSGCTTCPTGNLSAILQIPL